ncbi:MAG: hypothetical protein WAM50_12560, partial [Pseudolabrys sp.]
MSQLLHAGIIAASRQLAALIVISLILFLSAPVNETFWLPATPFLTWGYLLMAAGFALTSGQSIDITAPYFSRILSHATRPPYPIIVIVQYFGCGSAASVIWTVGVACFGASAHAVLRTIEI